MEYVSLIIGAFVVVLLLMLIHFKLIKKTSHQDKAALFNRELYKIRPVLNALDDDVMRSSSLGFGNIVKGSLLSERKLHLYKIAHLDPTQKTIDEINAIENELQQIKAHPVFTKVKIIKDLDKIPRVIKDLKRYRKKVYSAYSRGDVSILDGNKDASNIDHFEKTITCFYYIKKLKIFNDNKDFQAITMSAKLEQYFHSVEFDSKSKFLKAYENEAKRTSSLFRSGEKDGD